jgi:hypothetical protein
MHGTIIAWYLPGILKQDRQVRSFTCSTAVSILVFQDEMMAATTKLYPLLGSAPIGAEWRNDPKNFIQGPGHHVGTVTLSPAWFQQGQDVS